MTTAQKITAIERSGQHLAYDGCHKIYLLADSDRVADAANTGYGIFPAAHIRTIILGSCGLVFVSNWALGDGDWHGEWTIDQGTEDIYTAAESDPGADS